MSIKSINTPWLHYCS